MPPFPQPARLIALLLFAGGALIKSPAQPTDPKQTELGEYQRLEQTLKFLRARSAREFAITTANGIDEGTYVKVGGLEQWVTIRGEDRRNPVLLLLHGGPGDATNPWGYAILRPWMKDFTLVQWDQRGAGRTYGRNGPGSVASITIERMVKDGIELSQLLAKRLQKPKIVLVGHLWGSILGALMAKARPDLFYAFVGTGQVADPPRNYAVAYTALLDRAIRDHNAEAMHELRDVGPPPYRDGRGFGVQRKWSNRFEGANMFINATLGIAFAAPDSTLEDLNNWFDGQMASGDRLVPATANLDPHLLGGKFELPVIVIQGAEDYTTPTSLAKAFVNSIQAPLKGFYTIPEAGHFAAFMRPDAFLLMLKTHVLPLIHE